MPQAPDVVDTHFTLYTKANSPSGFTLRAIVPPVGVGSGPVEAVGASNIQLSPSVAPTSFPNQPPPPESPLPTVNVTGSARSADQEPDVGVGSDGLVTQHFKERSTFNATAPTKIIIHGFGSSAKRMWVMQVGVLEVACVTFIQY